MTLLILELHLILSQILLALFAFIFFLSRSLSIFATITTSSLILFNIFLPPKCWNTFYVSLFFCPCPSYSLFSIQMPELSI